MGRWVMAWMAAAVLGTLAGCCSVDGEPKEETVVARYAGTGFKADATMSDPAWQKAKEYKLYPFVNYTSQPEKTAAAIAKTKHWNDVWAKVLYDDANLYVGVRFENDDIRALKQQDQGMLFLYGDTVEVFLKPAKANNYFELYMTAGGNKSSYHFPSRSLLGTDLDYYQKLLPGLSVSAAVDGTLNDGSDVDRQWTAVMTISRKMLEEQSGVKFDDKNPWTILLSGYGYSQNKIFGSWFAYPKLPELNYHRTEYYAPLILEQK